ncbi:MAG: HD domain-containing phosphohydrolase [Pseudomonadota bacterium]
MMQDSEFQKKLIKILSLMTAAISSHRLYLSHNPYVSGNMERAYGELLDLLQADEPITLFLAGEDVVVNRRRLIYVSPATEKFARILKSKGIESVTFLSGLQENEFHQFVRDLASSDSPSIISRNCIKLGKVELRINESDGSGENANPGDAGTSEETSGRSIRQTALSAGQEADQLAEQYLKIHQEKKIEFRDVGQILTKFISELKRNISPIFLLGTVKSFHEYTYTHLINVSILSMSLADKLGFTGNQPLEIGIAALLHDVGKTFIPDEILNKPGVLSNEERAIIESHPVKGGLHLMKLAGIPKIVILSALEHHIKFDGTGYPAIRPGWKPNIVAQMISICDVFDALRSRRSYNEPKTLKVIAAILRKEKGSTFNPILVDTFLEMINPEDVQPNEESQGNRRLISMNSSGSGQPDLNMELPRPSEIPIEKASDQISDAGSHPKEDKIMDTNLRLEQLVDQHLAENRIDAAVSTLYRLIVAYAKEKNFTKAESLREKLYEIDSMALTEIISSAEIIEQEKQKGMTQDHQETWTDLYRTIGKEEGTCLYYSMKEVSYNSDQPLFIQGEGNSNLYFVKQGQLKMLCRHNGQDVLLKQLNPGDIVGIETFFSESVCTTTVSPFSRVKVGYLEKRVLQEWKEKFPALESKLHSYCLKFEKSCDLLKKKGLDRRAQKRFRIAGNASIQILSSSGVSVGKPFRGLIVDISASGLACMIKLIKKEIAQLLLGRKMELKLIITVKGVSRTIGQIGTVVAVSSPPFDDYYLHFKFHQLLDSTLIREIAASHTESAN